MRLECKIERMLTQLNDKSPHATVEGIYDSTRLDWWTSGFWPGMLWIMYSRTGKNCYLERAWDFDIRLEQKLGEDNNFHHDVGFQFLPTAVIKYKLTGDADARRRGLHAANLLAGRFNLAGQFIRAWNPVKDKTVWNAGNTGWAIIDSAMNLALLLWAAEELDDPRFRHIAQAHADTILEHFIRPDGSVRHICSFDPESGAFLASIGGQGFGPDSAWSRGAAWALHGLAVVYRYTRVPRYLDAAKQIAHFFLAATENDAVPVWDFRAIPAESSRITDADSTLESGTDNRVFNPLSAHKVGRDAVAKVPRDTSAAACAASGLLELAVLVPFAEQDLYYRQAERILMSLSERYASWDEPSYEGILREATGNLPAGSNINVSLIYGDYFFLEAAAKLTSWDYRIF